MEMSGEVYVCSAGETFDIIAREVYDDESYAADLLCANPELAHKYILDAGDEIRLPVIYIPEPDDNASDEDADVTIPPAPWR